jgi:putative hydrolase of the HAD superfamily
MKQIIISSFYMVKQTNKRSLERYFMNKKNSLKAVFFDFGGTLMDSESDKIAHIHMMKDIKEQYQLPVSEKILVSMYESQLFNHDMTIKNRSQNNNGQFTRLHFYSENAFKFLLQEFNIEISDSDLNCFNKIYLDNHLKFIKLVEGSTDAISLVKEKGYHCGIISDIDNDYQLKQFQALNLDNAFHSITTSEEVKAYKPSERIYKVALDKANCQGNEALMVGDSYNKDIAGGKNLNMTTIWINRYQDTKEETCLADYIIKEFKEILPIFKEIL